MPLQWEVLQENFSHRAPAPLFGSIRVERYASFKPWLINWSVPGFSDTLIEGKWENLNDAKRAAEKHVRAAYEAMNI